MRAMTFPPFVYALEENLSLPLFVPGVLTDYADNSGPFNDLALAANLFH
jgi:hypothetical protein